MATVNLEGGGGWGGGAMSLLYTYSLYYTVVRSTNFETDTIKLNPVIIFLAKRVTITSLFLQKIHIVEYNPRSMVL